VRHADQISPAAFARWLQLWSETTRELLPPDAAAAMQEKAGRIAESLALGMQFYKDRAARLASTLE
jgi:hemoglobin